MSVSDRQAPQFQRADAKRMQDPEAAAARQAAQPDPGWDYNIGEAPTKGIEQAVARKRQECGSTQLARSSPAAAAAVNCGARTRILRTA
ncbi:hypothetical protein [uncultured Lamprocystis sp.]|uniref:hypothetical protein n=1 Tax=uncultured Lamprocystis sp. TaxID=543132 RepID=UPI0025EDE3D4|nr:hypothetical protein [uncultured Lamprocystis sp.]